MLRLPGKLNTPAGWSVQAKLSIYLWLGIIQNKQFSYSGLPKGFDLSPEIRNAERRGALSPSNVHYIEKHVSLNNFFFCFPICLLYLSFENSFTVLDISIACTCISSKITNWVRCIGFK